QNWTKRVMGGAKIEDLCRKSRNGKPTARLVESRKDGNALIGILEIADPDGEQVYGKASVGGNSTAVRAGRREFRIDNANGDRLEVKFSDGYDTVDQTFDL
ncbi:MAG TPA: hypothetical protein VGG33_29680, partial [Polyangia bacterium]